nr:unnamed protein product [Callosobruchus analis]
MCVLRLNTALQCTQVLKLKFELSSGCVNKCMLNLYLKVVLKLHILLILLFW